MLICSHGILWSTDSLVTKARAQGPYCTAFLTPAGYSPRCFCPQHSTSPKQCSVTSDFGSGRSNTCRLLTTVDCLQQGSSARKSDIPWANAPPFCLPFDLTQRLAFVSHLSACSAFFLRQTERARFFRYPLLLGGLWLLLLFIPNRRSKSAFSACKRATSACRRAFSASNAISRLSRSAIDGGVSASEEFTKFW